ncbi:MAG: hypothetical protein O2887_11380 [Bacteroidetes bacterium]|nr:hypothetical protein [Bacteroidota bacterium]MDA1121073.1 hypothetical protein [Bacteroidota bacterium]
MSVIGIEIPRLDEEQNIEVEIKINGIKKQFHYRVEIFYWEECPYPADERVECIKSLISNYNPDWDLAYIGVPNDDYIPITFKKKRDLG